MLFFWELLINYVVLDTLKDEKQFKAGKHKILYIDKPWRRQKDFHVIVR